MSTLLSQSLFSWFEPAARPDAPQVPASPFFWMPNEASTTAGNIDLLFDTLVWISVISAAAILAAMVHFCTRYRSKGRSAEDKAESQEDHSNTLELTWSIIPLFIVIAVFVWGFKDYAELRLDPKNATEIYATGQKWKWTFTYPMANGEKDDKLVVPQGKDVRIMIESVDVLHSLFLPEFRVKMDAVPGRYTSLWFNATKAGTFPIYCTEYCGTSHSDMLSRVVVKSEKEFGEYIQELIDRKKTLPPVKWGEMLYTQRGCATCHSLDGSPRPGGGPSFKGVFGKQESLADGSKVSVDENYIRESLEAPAAKVVQGYPPVMPTFKGQLDEIDLRGLIAFIKAQK